MSKRVRIAQELVEDLNLARFCERSDFGRGHWYLIDRRRLKRELRRLPRLKAEAKASFQAQLDDLGYMRRTYGCEYYYAANGQMVSRADLLRIHELVEAALVRSIQPAADMLRPRPAR
jgi:hypothetical protein